MKTHMILRNLLTVTLFTCLFISANAQEIEKDPKPEKPKKEINGKEPKFDPSTAILFAPIYTAQFPFGNMADRFGFNNLFGMQIAYKLKKNWLIAVEGNFLFGTKLRDNYVLDNISTTTGQFISQNNDLIRVRSQEQGCNIKVEFGKIIPFSTKYPDAGLLIMTGGGYLQHKIAINVKESSLPQLSKTYRKGYDRLCSGPIISQFIGGVFLARRKFISAYAGLQFDVGFTQNRRNFDFYSMQKLSEKRIDMFLGVRVGWIIPVFIQASEKEYYYY